MPEATIQEFRLHATQPAGAERPPSFLHMPSIVRRGVHYVLAVSRDPAAEMFETALFAHDVVTLSATAHDSDRRRVDIDLAEVLACIDRLLGPGVPPMLRSMPSPVVGSTVTYFRVLADGERFYAPSPLQDAYLARHFGARGPMIA